MSDCGFPFTADEQQQSLCRRCGVEETRHQLDTHGRRGRERLIDGEPVWIFKLKRMRFRAMNRIRERS